MVLEEIPLSDVRPASFQPLLEAWFAARGKGGDCPPVSAINPFVVPALAANVILLGIAGDSFVYRVVGDDVRRLAGRDLRGMTVRDLYGDVEYGRTIEAHYRQAVADRLPIHLVDQYRRPQDRLTLATWRLVMPYAENGEVTRLLAVQTFDSCEPHTFSQLPDAMSLRRMFRLAEAT